jgi:LTXXQ motif family protein
VKGMLLTAAMTAAISLAMPAGAQAPQPNANPQAAPAPPSAPEQAPDGAEAGEQQGGGGWMHREGGWGMRGGPMMRHRMWQRAATGWNPQQRCIDRLAWRAAHRAYLETELNLTAQQQPLWDKLQGIAQSEQQRERQLCSQIKPPQEMTALDRLDRAQQFLSARLDALNAAKPAVQALYQSLSPEQRAIFDHPFRRD